MTSYRPAGRGVGNGFQCRADFDGRCGPWFRSSCSGQSGWRLLPLEPPHAEDQSVRSSPSTITPQRYSPAAFLVSLVSPD
jgi:hypothetical protein